MKKLGIAVTLAAALYGTTAAAAETDPIYNGNGLLSACRGNDNYSLGKCSGFIQAITWWFSTDELICFPEGSTQGQTRDVVIKYIEDHPESRHRGSDELILMATQEAWGVCK